MHFVPCAICDDPVIINIEVWNSFEYPAALCQTCDFLVPWSILKVIHMLRSKIFQMETQDMWAEAPVH